jgi:hypothetical protein
LGTTKLRFRINDEFLASLFFQTRLKSLKKAALKLTFEQSLAKPDGKVFTEDLKTLMYLSKTDGDIELLLNAIKR